MPSRSPSSSRRRTQTVFKRAARAAAVAAYLLGASSSSLVAAQYPSSDTACTRSYTVQAGDTCDKIGQKTFTSTYQIMANNLPKAGPNCYSLEIGAQLCLGKFGNDCQFVHHVRNYNTCDSIANHFGISVDTLKANNPTMACDNLYDGLMVCVSQGLIRPPTPSALDVVNGQVASGQMPLGTAINAKTVASSSASSATSSSSGNVSSSAPVATSSSSIAGVAAFKNSASGHKHRHGKVLHHH